MNLPQHKMQEEQDFGWEVLFSWLTAYLGLARSGRIRDMELFSVRWAARVDLVRIGLDSQSYSMAFLVYRSPPEACLSIEPITKHRNEHKQCN